MQFRFQFGKENDNATVYNQEKILKLLPLIKMLNGSRLICWRLSQS